MARDWTSVINLANRLIATNGRSVQFVKEVQAVADAAKPWRSTASDATDEVQTLNAVFVPDGAGLGFDAADTDLFRDATQIAIVAPELGATYELDTYHQVVEANGRQWRYSGVKKLQPGTVPLLYIIGMKS